MNYKTKFSILFLYNYAINPYFLSLKALSFLIISSLVSLCFASPPATDEANPAPLLLGGN